METRLQNNSPEESPELKYYGTTARHYDAAYAADSRLRDTPFYLELAKAVNGRTLEVACGTGRVLIPIARAGVRIDGFDFSPELLSILREKLKSEAPELRDQISLYEADMRDFALGQLYDLITIPFRPLQHLFTVDDQLSAFRCFHAHLNRGGKLAFNVFYPNFQLLEEVGVERMELEWRDPLDSSITVRRSFLRTSVDKLNQISRGEFIFRSYRGEELLNEERSTLNMSYYSYPQILLLLRSTGFRVREEFGTFDKEPISVCKEMIFVVEKE